MSRLRVSRTCGDITEPFIQALNSRPDLPPVQIIGGNGAAALLNPDTVIDLAARTISAPAGCDLPRHRADGSIRDLDTLVLSTTVTEVAAVEALGEQSVRGQLKVSAFGLKTLDDLERQIHRPLSSTARVFLADRYVAATYDGARNLVAVDGHKALFPFRVPIGVETLETFHLLVRGRTPVPTSHPGATILNYLTRSISGLRAKDAAKVDMMAANVLIRYPEIEAWIHDGPGRSTLELARVLHTLREPRHGSRTLRLGNVLEIVPFKLDELHEHSSFMAGHRSVRMQRLLVESSHVKARVLARFEANASIVGLWQKHVEDRIGRIIRNEL